MASPTNPSEPTVSSVEIERDYPMPSYVAAWKTYRTLSNEDEVIAQRLASTITLHGSDTRFLDIGPGDGRVLVRTLVRLNETPARLTFVEPNPAFCDETVRTVFHEDFERELVPLNKRLGDCSDEELAGHDVIACTHTAYFLTDAEFERLIDLVAGGARLYVVIDHPDSIFAQLWKKTAPHFHERVTRHVARIKALDSSVFSVSETVISARISDPATLRKPVSNLVMSMLCYSDVEDMLDDELDEVRRLIASRTREGRIDCDSYFFEITARNKLLRAVR